jgi:enoyl-CoA hydratase
VLEAKDRDGIVILTMAHGKANALDIEFCEAIAARFKALEHARAVVLTGQGRIFSAGVDLVRLLEGGPDYIREFLPVLDRCFRAVFEFPRPVVAALNGHAVAGGCVLACAADRRIIAQDGGRVGVTELQVGVPFPPLALEIMRFATAPHLFEDVILGASTHAPEAARERGLVHEIVPPQTVLDRAVETARSLAAISPAAYALSKRQTRRAAFAASERGEHAHGEEIIRLWTSQQALGCVRDYVARTLKKS